MGPTQNDLTSGNDLISEAIITEIHCNYGIFLEQERRSTRKGFRNLSSFKHSGSVGRSVD